MGFDVVGLGCSAYDILCVTPRWPRLDEKVAVEDILQQGGGMTATALVAVARLGGSAAMVGKVGHDDFGRFMVGELQAEGVDVRAVRFGPPGGSHFAFCVADQSTGKRTIFYRRGQGEPLRADEVDRDLIVSGRTLLVDGHHMEAAIRAAGWAKAAGIPVVMDAENYKEGLDELIERVDYLVPSREFAAHLTGADDPVEAARLLTDRGPHTVIVTLGADGCAGVHRGEPISQRAYRVQVVDTTGAGDVFHGVVCLGLAWGWKFRKILRYASAVAGLKCRRLGGRTGIPSLAETEEFLKSGIELDPRET